MQITHRYTLVCDEVRREDNGKLLLIGVYQHIILVPQFPATFPLTFVQALESDRPGNWSVRMRLQHLETGQRIMEGMGALTFQKPGFAFNPVRLPPVQFQASGTYHFVIEVENQPEPIIYEFALALRGAHGQAGQQMAQPNF